MRNVEKVSPAALEYPESILKDAQLAFNYASDVIEGRFPEGEKAIASEPLITQKYFELAWTTNNRGDK